jgi:hypothetical protein
MHTIRNKIWTWLLPDAERPVDENQWLDHGGKWIIFDRKENIVQLATRLGPFIDSGKIQSAKYWNGDPSAINVYSLDSDRDKTWEILQEAGASDARVWEYDYAWCKNIGSPSHFLYSWFSKFSTILRSYGVRGTLELIREIMLSK